MVRTQSARRRKQSKRAPKVGTVSKSKESALQNGVMVGGWPKWPWPKTPLPVEIPKETAEILEGNMFLKLRRLGFLASYRNESYALQHSKIAKLTEIKSRVGVPARSLELFSNVCQARTSVADTLYYKNRAHFVEGCFKPKTQQHVALSRQNNYARLHNNIVVNSTPVDFTSYLRSRPIEFDCVHDAPEKKDILEIPLFKKVVTNVAFFNSHDEFKQAVSNLEHLTHRSKAHVFYVFAEFYSQLSLLTQALMNAELYTYYTHLYSSSSIRGQLLLNGTRSALVRKADRAAQLDKDLGSGNAASKFTKYSFGGGEQDLDISALVQLVEVFLAEPYRRDDQETYSVNFQAFEPVCTGFHELAGIPDGEFLYVQDVRSKLLISLRECRKYMLLAEFHDVFGGEFSRQSNTTDSVQRLENLSQTLRNSDKSNEEKADLIYQSILKPAVIELDKKVRHSVTAVGKKLMSQKGWAADETMQLLTAPSENLETSHAASLGSDIFAGLPVNNNYTFSSTPTTSLYAPTSTPMPVSGVNPFAIS